MPATNELFRNLISPAILASAGLLVLFHKPRLNTKSIIIFAVIAVLVFIVEALGVKTGNIFGQYSYGNNLGPAVAGTPLLISVNWLMLIYCSIIITDRISSNTSIRFLAPPFFMVIYDLILEQAAIILGMWSWDYETIPVRNYIVWFGLSLLFTSLIRLFKLSFSNKLAPYIMITQFIFFVILVTYFKLILND